MNIEERRYFYVLPKWKQIADKKKWFDRGNGKRLFKNKIVNKGWFRP